MKKTLLPLAVLALSLSACDTTPKYTINGTVEGEQTGTAYLVTYAKQKADTLAKGDIADGKFTLSGNVEKPDSRLPDSGRKKRRHFRFLLKTQISLQPSTLPTRWKTK